MHLHLYCKAVVFGCIDLNCKYFFIEYEYNQFIEEVFFFSITLYPAYSMIGRGNMGT